MATQFEKLMNDSEFKTAVTTLQTEAFDLSDVRQYQQFMNAIAVVLNKGFAEGYEHGVTDFAKNVRQLRHATPREGIMPIDRRNFELTIQHHSVSEHPDMPLEMDFEHLQLGIHAYSHLVRAGVRTVSDLTSKTVDEISKIMATSQYPDKDIADVRTSLAQYGYTLRGDTVLLPTV